MIKTIYSVLFFLFIIFLTACSENNGDNGVINVRGWELNETNTGLKGDYSNLTDFDAEGDADLGYIPEWNTLTLYDNATIENRIISNEVACGANNIIRHCLIRPASVGNGMPIINGTSLVIEDCEIDAGLLTNASHIGVSLTGSIKRCNIHGMSTGIYINNTDSIQSVCENNYIHDLVYTEGSDAHMDGITVRASSGTGGILILNNRAITDNESHTTGAFFSQPYNGLIENMTVEGNLFEGCGYCLYIDNHGSGYGTNLYIINNRMNPYSCAWGPLAVDPLGSVTITQFSENYIYDPDAEDGKGSPVSL